MKINPEYLLKAESIGLEQTSVLIIDNAFAEIQPMIDQACTESTFSRDLASFYPGIRARLPRDYIEAVVGFVADILAEEYSIPTELQPVCRNGYFSLVTLPAEKLHPLQCIPHFDNNTPYYFAITHYLNQGKFGGTSLYRHRPTGFENITKAREKEFISSLRSYLAEHHGKEPPSYVFGSNDQFESLASIPFQSNRMVVYPGTLLHSGDIDPSRDISADPRTGRLTTNVFVEFT